MEEHVHHWRIETARSPHSQGVCTTCGALKDFNNTIPAVSHKEYQTRVNNYLQGVPKSEFGRLERSYIANYHADLNCALSLTWDKTRKR